MTHHDYQRAAEAQREDDAEFGNAGRSPDVLPGAGVFAAFIVALVLGALGLWWTFG